MPQVRIPKSLAKFLRDNETIMAAVFWSYVKRRGPGVLILEKGVKDAFKLRFQDYESAGPEEQQLCDCNAPSVACIVRIGNVALVVKPKNKPPNCVPMVKPQIHDFIKGWVKGTDEEVLKNLIK